ncbi:MULTISPECIES: GntR family transcriptional regulator [unclassified Streptomyces]|uniref:GntR family transcriptional regulator n=1 Tax=unclassified Streptomyces TaxID=2593676 RepID=UPI001BE5DBC0|nr:MULTISPECIES: GntR family transcriptional regulator [unclassified Streptomyces]MBT2405746.1 GntR family transcriptional regulator [Streptomyces sp. ISL-21]MBT2610358.1 GntR family transcriptional regulator [Streptomyces sp. ISL-87]
MALLKYEQIAESLRRRISDAEFGPGDLLPSSRDLCEQWAVSRATAIKAMEVLRVDGLVVPHQGRGFAVTEVPVARPAGGRGSGATRAQGGPYRRLGAPEMLVPPSHVADALGLAAGRQALHRARLVLTEEGQPHSYVVAWFPPEVSDLCPRLHQNGPIAEGTTHYVRRVTGRLSVRGMDATSVRLATRVEAELLQVKRPCAVAVVLHTAYDQDGTALVCEEGITPEGLWERTDNYPMNQQG